MIRKKQSRAQNQKKNQKNQSEGEIFYFFAVKCHYFQATVIIAVSYEHVEIFE